MFIQYFNKLTFLKKKCKINNKKKFSEIIKVRTVHDFQEVTCNVPHLLITTQIYFWDDCSRYN